MINCISSISSKAFSKPSVPVWAGNVYIVNSNFATNNPPTQTGLSETTNPTFANTVSGWTKIGGISTGVSTESANDVRLLNNLTNNNAAPRFWNAQLYTGGTNILTGLYVAQNRYTSFPKTFSVSQTITIPVIGTYNCRFWAAPRTDQGANLRNDLYNSSQSIKMYVGTDIFPGASGKTFATTNALTPTGFYPGFELVSGNITTTANNETRVLKFEWVQTANNNSCIMITGIEINKIS